MGDLLEADACWTCRGTGDGQHEGACCTTCGGSGVERGTPDDDFIEPDDEPECHRCYDGT